MTETLPHWRTKAPAGVSLAAARAAVAAPPSLARSWTMDRILWPDATPRWRTLLARNYTPERIEQVLRNAMAGDHVSQWELFDLMEDTWARLCKNLNELKRAVRSLDWNICPWAEEEQAPSPEAELQARIVSKAIWKMHPRADENENGMAGTIYDLLDAWAKGTAVLEIDWELRQDAVLGQFYAPRCTRWVHPSNYAWADDGQWLGLRAEALVGSPSMDRNAVVRFPEDKFIVGICKSRSGHPLAGALLRPLAFWWCSANFTAEWFLNFAQIFGVPIRWAQYDPSVPGLMEKVADMMENMGSSAWAVVPAGTTIEIKEPAKTGADNPQVALLDRADRQCDILILGQTLTTDVADSGSRALGDVHAAVRQDVLMAAAEWLEYVLQDQLVLPICRLNWSNDDQAPEIEAEPHKREDEKANAERDAILLGAGVDMPAGFVYKRHKIPMPVAGEPVIKGRVGAQPMEAPVPDPLAAKSGAPDVAAADDPAARIAERRREVLGKAYRGAMAPFREAILASSSREDCLARLRALYRDWPAGRLETELEAALQLCAAHGVAQVAEDLD